MTPLIGGRHMSTILTDIKETFGYSLKLQWEKSTDKLTHACHEPYKPYNAVDGRILTAVYGVDPYRNRTIFIYFSSPYGTGTGAVIRMP